MEKIKIYTKTGDNGTTSLFSGKRIPKYDIRIKAYGSIDELNAFIGNIFDQKISKSQKETLLKIQNQLFNMGSCIAFDDSNKKMKLPNITEENISFFNEILRHTILGVEIFPESIFSLQMGYSFRRSEELRILEQRNFSGISFGFGMKFNKLR